MKRLTILFTLLVFTCIQVFSQAIVITGTVTSAEDGFSLPGVSIVVRGTTIGTITDVDGNYSLAVPETAIKLMFTFVGMKTVEETIGGRSVIDVTLEVDIMGLEEVVVTALGISREKKALGYAVQDVSGDKLIRAPESNIVNSLQGRVAGVQINSSSGAMGGSSRILIRGANSVTGNNQPLFVIDGVVFDNSNFKGGFESAANQETGRGGFDYGNAAQDLNPNDIETISILKGASAAALYGSRASNGVIVITTKSGKEVAGKKGIGISYSGSVLFEQLSILPDYQDSYGGGYGFDTLWYNTLTADEQAMYMPRGGTYSDPVEGPYDLLPHYAVDESWGPKLDGQTSVRHWDSWDSWDTENFGLSRPWEPSPHDVEDFFETGVTYNNHIALTGGSNVANFRLSYTNMNKSGVFPNSELKRNTVNFSGNANLSNKLSAFTKFNYVTTNAKGRPGTGYDGMNPLQSFNQWTQRQLDYERLKNYKNPDGTQRTWNRQAYFVPEPMYTDNPYWTRKENYQNDRRDRYYGNIGARYMLTDWLNVTGKIHLDHYVDRREERRAIGSSDVPAYLEGIRELQEMNSELIISFDRALSQMFNLSAFLGVNSMNRKYHRNIGETSGGLGVPNWYHLDNSLDLPTVDDYLTEKKINSIFGNASLSYRDMLFLDFTLRKDWSSTLPEDNNTYNYPGVSAGFLVSELLNTSWLPFAKLRVSWAKVGSDTDPYDTQLTYRPYANFGPNPRLSVPATLNNPDLLPEMTTSFEVGADLKFINNRLGLDVTYYDNKTEDQIIPVDISATSGYRSYFVNAGLMTNKGVEVMAYVRPVQTSDFSWEIYANWAKNINEVVELAEGLDNLMLNNAPFRVTINAKVGETYGAIMGNNHVYKGGEKVVRSNGMYAWSSDLHVLGSAMADWTGGLGNTITYKGIRLNFLIDAQKGGQYFSTSHMFGTYSGITKITVENNIREEGIVLDGVMDDGTANTTVLDAESYGLNHYLCDPLNIFDADFFKLRELSLGYTLPKSLTGNLPFENITISFVGRNLATWGTDNKNFDPEQATSTSNFQGLESAQLPSIRSFGFNISFNL